MAQVIDALDDALIEWIGEQHVFFVASAPSAGGHVNVSPKGYDSFRVLDQHTVAYLDLTGSGAETIAHVRDNGRLTIMFCAFDGPPRILRLFGTGRVHVGASQRYAELAPRFTEQPGARTIIELTIDRIQTSCGFSVPFMQFSDERPTLRQWAARREPEQLAEYHATKNTTSIDGLPALAP
jgi:hypothetical protein